MCQSGGLYSALNTRRDGRAAGSGPFDPPSPADDRRDCLPDDVDTFSMVSDPAHGQNPALTRGVSHQADKEGTAAALHRRCLVLARAVCPHLAATGYRELEVRRGDLLGDHQPGPRAVWTVTAELRNGNVRV